MIDIDVNDTLDLTPETLMDKFNLEPGGLAQQTLTRSVITHMLPYWAWDTGRLANSAYLASDYDTGRIVYNVDYANKMYYGVDELGRVVHYHTDEHPLAGPYPFDRMIADHLEDIVGEVRQVVTDQ